MAMAASWGRNLQGSSGFHPRLRNAALQRRHEMARPLESANARRAFGDFAQLRKAFSRRVMRNTPGEETFAVPAGGGSRMLQGKSFRLDAQGRAG